MLTSETALKPFWSDTGYTTAHLTAVTDHRLAALHKSFGEDHARAAWDAGFAAIAQIDECVRAEKIACDFGWVPGYLFAAGDGAPAPSDTEACYTRLERALKARLPDVALTHRWSGQVIETNDGLPLIGELAPKQFVSTGYSGNGITFGTVGAMMAADAVTGRRNPWAELFDTGRTKILGGLWDYVRENKDYPYYLVRDRFAGAEGRSVRAVQRGTGKVLSLDGKPVAVYREMDGSVVKRSAVCTHLGCLVQWNAAEKTWDCPCHGSRFTTSGRVIGGPAETPLEEPRQD